MAVLCLRLVYANALLITLQTIAYSLHALLLAAGTGILQMLRCTYHSVVNWDNLAGISCSHVSLTAVLLVHLEGVSYQPGKALCTYYPLMLSTWYIVHDKGAKDQVQYRLCR